MKKFRLLIADDEYYIRMRIKKIIDWDSLGFVFAGEAENGSQVIAQLENHIDLIILDIKMPGLSGLNVAEHISEHKLNTKIIVLSGFGDFAYAQQFIRHGVVDYLLKPVDATTLNSSLKKAEELLQAEAQNRLKPMDDFAVNRQKEYLAVLTNSADQASFREAYLEQSVRKTQFLGVYNPYKSSSHPIDFDEILQGLSVELYQVDRSSREAVYQLFYNDDHMAERLLERLAQVRLESPCFVFISKLSDVDLPWQSQFYYTTRELYQRYFYTLPQIIHQKEQVSGSDNSEKLLDIRHQLTKLINTNSIDQLEDYLVRIKSSVLKKSETEYLRHSVFEISSTLAILFYNQNRDKNNIREEITQLLETESSLDELFDYIIDYCKQKGKEQNSLPSDVLTAQRLSFYIDNNYNDTNLSVASVAETLGITPSYAGVIFKRINGLSINQYINRIRIKEACDLLVKRDVNITEIAQRVGYNDVFYFSRRFKSIVGVSPTEFSKNQPIPT